MKVLMLAMPFWLAECNGPAVAESVQEAPEFVQACPADNFEAFIGRFVDDVEVQRRHTASPLQWDFVDAGAEPEPRLVTRMFAAAEIEYPVIPDAERQAIVDFLLELK